MRWLETVTELGQQISGEKLSSTSFRVLFMVEFFNLNEYDPVPYEKLFENKHDTFWFVYLLLKNTYLNRCF